MPSRRECVCFLLVVVLLVGFVRPTWAESPPDGTITELYLSSLNDPIALAFAADGRLFYTEKGGYSRPASPRVMTLRGAPGAVSAKVWLQLENVDALSDRGLLGIALAPDFNVNGYVYTWYPTRAFRGD
jgi:glucose/arabinose dehydrogenase